jgi:hypothetical protein
MLRIMLQRRPRREVNRENQRRHARRLRQAELPPLGAKRFHNSELERQRVYSVAGTNRTSSDVRSSGAIGG